MILLSPQVPKLVDRFGVARVVPVGLSSVALGLVLFSLLGVDTSIWFVYGPILFLAAGMALTMTPLTTQIMAAVPVTKAGVGSAMNDTTRELGGALGVAVLGSLVTSTYASSLGDAVNGLSGADRAAAESGLVGAFGVAQRLGCRGRRPRGGGQAGLRRRHGRGCRHRCGRGGHRRRPQLPAPPPRPGCGPRPDDDVLEGAASDEEFALAD